MRTRQPVSTLVLFLGAWALVQVVIYFVLVEAGATTSMIRSAIFGGGALSLAALLYGFFKGPIPADPSLPSNGTKTSPLAFSFGYLAASTLAFVATIVGGVIVVKGQLLSGTFLLLVTAGLYLLYFRRLTRGCSGPPTRGRS